jgi:diaminopimelate epimerase
MTALAFSKGHGTHNDFVLLNDPEGNLDLDETLVARLADRRGGIGGDGVIRVIKSEHLSEGREVLTQESAAVWFMDYRNADGSIAQMCGNGVRVFAAYLERLGLVDFTDGMPVPIGTRAGLRTVRKEGDWFTVGMGKWRFTFPEQAGSAGLDSEVRLVGISGTEVRPALSIDMGNPHTVAAVSNADELASINFTDIPEVSPLPPHGTNVEVVVPLPAQSTAEGSVGHIAMRVHERGVGETQSCGTGACAAALAVRHWLSQSVASSQIDDDTASSVPDVWLVDVPGGQVRVSVSGQDVELSGPAVIVADGALDTALL